MRTPGSRRARSTPSSPWPRTSTKAPASPTNTPPTSWARCAALCIRLPGTACRGSPPPTRSGAADVAVVEAHSKASNIVHHEEILALALDPTYERPWRVNPHAVAALEMRRYLHEANASPGGI